MKTQMLTVVVLTLGACSSLSAMNGKAAVVITNMLSPFYGPQPATPSRLIVSTINNNSVTKVDTLLNDGTFYYPTFSPDGSKIAFYRNGAGLSIIDANGNDLHTLVQLSNWAPEGQDQAIVWPMTDGGNWIYYHRSCSGCDRNSSGEIWKVNVNDATQTSMLCDYKKQNSRPSGSQDFPPSVDRFQMSTDTKHAVIWVRGTEATLGYKVSAIIPHAFPPQVNSGTGWIDPWLTSPSCTEPGECHFYGDCNSALSPSGKLMYHFRGGHCELYGNYWDHNAETMTPTYDLGTGFGNTLGQYTDVERWLTGGPDVGACFIYPRGSSNSDQIVTIICAYQYSAEYGHSSCGSNLVVANWKDKEAVMATNIPEPPHPTGDVTQGVAFQYCEPGDFWLDGGPAGCYEAIDGSWVPVAGAVAAGRGRITRAGAACSPSLHGTATFFDLKGARMGTFDAQAPTHGAPARLGRGTYIVTDARTGTTRLAVGR